MLAQSHVAPGNAMRHQRTRAFWMALAFYILAGPLVGLFSLLVIAFFMEAWGPIMDRLGALISHMQSSPSNAPFDPRQIDLGCFQRFEPRQLPHLALDRKTLSLGIFGAYMIGSAPALVAGLPVSVGGLRDRGVGLGYVVLVGTLIGFMTGVMAIYRPENAILLFFICLIATIVCWYATRRLRPSRTGWVERQRNPSSGLADV
jgi:hypothetical protein